MEVEGVKPTPEQIEGVRNNRKDWCLNCNQLVYFNTGAGMWMHVAGSLDKCDFRARVA